MKLNFGSCEVVKWEGKKEGRFDASFFERERAVEERKCEVPRGKVYMQDRTKRSANGPKYRGGSEREEKGNKKNKT